MILTALRRTSQVFCRWSLTLDLSQMFSWSEWGYGFLGRIPQRWSTLLMRLSQEARDLNMTYYWASEQFKALSNGRFSLIFENNLAFLFTNSLLSRWTRKAFLLWRSGTLPPLSNCSSRFFIENSLFFPLHTLFIGGKSLSTVHTQGWKLRSTFWTKE